ncbi:MAG: methyltransferase domain-containing protein [Hellea sp.]|nr:methyltransferase domain-containing protein [Hellea sp.]
MRQNVRHLESFYASRLGRAANNMVLRRLSTVWPDLTGRDVLGYGYCYPYVTPYLDSAKRVVLAMPGAMGAMAQRSSRGVMTCLTESISLPFEDAQFDNVLVAHGVEEANMLPELLQELWRVTRPEGRIIVIAANRSGLWARTDRSPFGAGRPFSRSQLKSALSDARFIPTLWSGALYIPPVKFLTGSTVLNVTETCGETVWPGFSGLVLVEAIKRLYAEPSGNAKEEIKRPIFAPKPVNQSHVE